METASLASLCSRISSGGTPSRKHPEYFADEGGHLWVKSQELVDRLISDTSEKISDLGLAKSSAKYYDEDTVLIAMYGATVGQLAILKAPATVNQAVCALCVDPEIADYRYVFYVLMATRHDLTIQAAGAAQQNLNQGLIRDFEIPIYPLNKQRRIANVLGSLDDLIENNRRRIEILEEMARLIYREWFVHFRFPGHEDVELVDSDLGPIPEGWDLGVIGDLGDVVTGSTPPTKEASLYGGLAPFLTPSDMTGERFVETARSLSEQGIERFERRMVPPGSVCFTCIGSIGKLAVAADLLLTNQQINSVVPLSPYSSGFIYQLLRDRSEYVLSIASGAATPIVNKSTFKAVEVLLPHPDVLASFDRVECTMGGLVHVLTHQNRVLGKARDLLLPRLISGELDVSDLDLDLEPVA